MKLKAHLARCSHKEKSLRESGGRRDRKISIAIDEDVDRGYQATSSLVRSGQISVPAKVRNSALMELSGPRKHKTRQ